MSKKEELSEQYRRKVYEDSQNRKRCKYNNELIQWNNEIIDAFESGWDAAKGNFLEMVCDAYCKFCGHYALKTQTHICRQDCGYYKAFRKAMLEE